MNTVEQVKRELGRQGHLNAHIASLTDALLGKADDVFMDAFGAASLASLVQVTFDFLKAASADINLRVYNPSVKLEGWTSDYTVIAIALKDRPFIVDSVRAALERQGVELIHLLHPILTVERTASGKFKGFGGQVREALELYFVAKQTPDRLPALESELRRILNDGQLATRDYAAMEAQTLRLQTDLLAIQSRSEAENLTSRAEEAADYAAFLAWLTEDNFVFLGYREYEIVSYNGEPSLRVKPDTGLGILSTASSTYSQPVPLSEIPASLRERVTGGRSLIVTKSNAESTVHRPARMDYIGVKSYDKDWQVTGERRILGLFTSKALSTPVEQIPILRLKLQRVLSLDGAVPGSHDYKQITSIFNSMPREGLFGADPGQLAQDIRVVMTLEQERGVRLTLRADPLGRGLNIMVIMPRERFNAEVRREVQAYLSEQLNAQHVDYQLAMGEDSASVRFHFFFTTSISHFDLDVTSLEARVSEITRSWDDLVSERLHSLYGHTGAHRLSRYLAAFSELYKADTTVDTAVRDIAAFEALGDAPYRVDLQNWDVSQTYLAVYHHQKTLALSDVMPLLENLGLRVIEQLAHSLKLPEETLGLDVYKVTDTSGQPLHNDDNATKLTEALTLLLDGQAENDPLNALVLRAGLSIRQVALLRAYRMYYGQLSAVTTPGFISTTLLNHVGLSGLLYAAFAARFNPQFDGDREAVFEGLKSDFLAGLESVSSLPEDTTLRGLFNLIEATVRTNYYLQHETISFKLESNKVTQMPEPRPLYEIGVLGLHVEGTHLRGGKVARGGLRWSDRPDDFRTEVLGLMKTQMTKNAVIVPVGSKGGFVLKRAPSEREALRPFVEAQYQNYLRGLLDITDNLVNGKTVHPAELIIYDEPDPYLVVAADKGTATFSDLANATAAEYDFWLGDAFASGGSLGYDHKKEGITARGAWECVSRHFRELGVNVQQDTFTAIGIGDMSGDVFGNGMLYTDTLELVAAFNHLHIFLDPTPDAKASFKERARLFALPRSSWTDYNPALISEGGGIFERAAKRIPLSPQIKERLDVSADSLSGQDLIRAILKAEVDLLWNGGIGTYVKATSETDAAVGDSSNDLVRIDAPDLRAAVVGEGGNLGFTQLGRVEYALAGGRINTDAIDNSAGVDMSDHEVNLKIMLQDLVRDAALSFAERNTLLADMTEAVNALVLKDNYYQSLALSLAERRSRNDPLLFQGLAEDLAHEAGLNAQVEFLPGRSAVVARARSGAGWTRPELAILLAYTKMDQYGDILASDWLDEDFVTPYLKSYFPDVLQQRYGEAITSHALRREIAATEINNLLVDLLGIGFRYGVIRETNAAPLAVTRAALVALELLDIPAGVRQINALDNKVPSELQYRALDTLTLAARGLVDWLLLQKVAPAATLEAYRVPLAELRRDLKAYLPPSGKKRFAATEKQWLKAGMPETLASDLTALEYLPSSLGVLQLAEQTSLTNAATAFYDVGERLSFAWLRDSVKALPAGSKWDTVALGTLVLDLRQLQTQLTAGYLDNASDWLAARAATINRYTAALAEVQAEDALSYSSAAVLTSYLRELL